MHNAYNPSGSGRPGDLGARRITRRRSSAGPLPPMRPQRPAASSNGQRSGPRPTFLTLRDHGKVFVADLPRLSDGQLNQVTKETKEVLASLERRLEELDSTTPDLDNDTRIRASTKREVTERFLRAIDEEMTLRRSNPALRAAAGESLAKAFLELARHRLPDSTFDSLLQEALEACGPEAAAEADSDSHNRRVVPIVRRSEGSERQDPLPVVLTPDPEIQQVG